MLFGAHVKALEDLQVLLEMGFDFGELVLSSPERRALWGKSGITSPLFDSFFLVAHGPAEGNPNDLDNIWNKYFPALQDTVDVVAKMGIGFLTVHLYSDSRFVKQEVLDEKQRLLTEIVSYAAARNVQIGLENLSERAADLVPVMAAVPNLAVTLDVGHAELISERNRSFEIVEALGSLIRHVHLHDNLGGSTHKDDLHLPVGAGCVDFRGILGALRHAGYAGTMTLEVPQASLQSSRNTVLAVLKAL